MARVALAKRHNGEVLMLNQGVVDTFWADALDPLAHLVPLSALLQFRLVCFQLADGSRRLIGNALAVLLPRRARMLTTRLSISRVSNFEMFRNTVRIVDVGFAFRLMEHGLVAKCGEGTGRLVAGSWALKQLMDQEEIMTCSHWPKWSPGDIDVFCDSPNAALHFRCEEVVQCATDAGLTDVCEDEREEDDERVVTRSHYQFELFETSGASNTISVPLLIKELQSDLMVQYGAECTRMLIDALPAAARLPAAELPRWRMCTKDLDGLELEPFPAASGLSRAWVSQDPASEGWYALKERVRLAKGSYQSERSYLNEKLIAVRRRIERLKHAGYHDSGAVAARELEIAELRGALAAAYNKVEDVKACLAAKAARPHAQVNVIPYEVVSYVDGQDEPPPPFETLVDGFDIVACQTWVRVDPASGHYVFGGAGADLVRSYRESGGVPVPLTLGKAWLGRHRPAVGDSHDATIWEEEMEEEPDRPPGRVSVVLERCLQRLQKYELRGFAPLKESDSD